MGNFARFFGGIYDQDAMERRATIGAKTGGGERPIVAHRKGWKTAAEPCNAGQEVGGSERGARPHALITGGSSGIGRALGNRYAAAGYNVSLIARRDDLLAEAAEEMRQRMQPDQDVGCHAADIADSHAIHEAVQAAIDDFGAPEIVVTSAGTSEPGRFLDLADDDFDRAMAVNYFGTLYTIRAALPAMRSRASGRIVLISSGAALMGVFGYASYGSSKFAVRGLAETLRAELRLDNIAVSIAYPPDTETPMLDRERLTMPPETRLICNLASTWSADAVADCILRGVERDAFAITPGLTLTLMHRAPGIVIPALRWYCDRLIAGVRAAARQPAATDGDWPLRVRRSARHAFMTFWYAYARVLNRFSPSITIEGQRLVIFPNVYKPLENEHVSSAYCRRGDRVLDLGCGSGVGTVFCAPVAAKVVAVDISLPAVRNTQENCRLLGLHNVEVMQSDMFSNVTGDYDLILANCPYIEDEFEVDEQQFATSVRYMPTLFAQVSDYLAEDGRLLIQFPLKGRHRIEQLAGQHGLQVLSVEKMPPKSAALSLMSALYLQIGFKSALFLLQRVPRQAKAA